LKTVFHKPPKFQQATLKVLRFFADQSQSNLVGLVAFSCHYY